MLSFIAINCLQIYGGISRFIDPVFRSEDFYITDNQTTKKMYNSVYNQNLQQADEFQYSGSD